MNKLSIIIVSAGVELWDTLTVPALRGLHKFTDPDDEIIVVDNGGLGRGDVNFETLMTSCFSYNAGARQASGDWLLFLNNDIHVLGPYREHLGARPLEGKTIHARHGGYISGWLVSIDRGLFELLNGFDEALVSSYGDVDLSGRAKALGFKLHQINPPIEHIGGRSRHVLKKHQGRHHQDKLLFYEKAKRIKQVLIQRDE